MRIDDFELLQNYQKEEAVSNHGKLITHISRGNIICDVYSLFSFYICRCYQLGAMDIVIFESSLDPDRLLSAVKTKQQKQQPQS